MDDRCLGPPRPESILVVVPAFNEAAALPETLTEIQAKLPDLTILVVDDGSEDQTAQIVEQAGALVVSMPFNVGVGGAMRMGFRYARALGFEAVVQIDADGQHDPGCVSKLIDRLGAADLVIGARFAGQGNYETRGPRRWAMLLLSLVLSRLAGVRLTDTTSGLRATGPRALEIFAREYPSEYLGDTVESLVIASRAGLSICQVPVEMRPRRAGRPSHGPIKAAIFLFRVILAVSLVLFRPRRSRRP